MLNSRWEDVLMISPLSMIFLFHSFKSNAISYFSIFSHLKSRDISCLQPNQCTSFFSIFPSHIFNIYHLAAEKVKNAPIIGKIKPFFF